LLTSNYRDPKLTSYFFYHIILKPSITHSLNSLWNLHSLTRLCRKMKLFVVAALLIMMATEPMSLITTFSPPPPSLPEITFPPPPPPPDHYSDDNISSHDCYLHSRGSRTFPPHYRYFLFCVWVCGSHLIGHSLHHYVACV
jgi:hypothetical protein